MTIPASGTLSELNAVAVGALSALRGYYKFVADGGIPGQTSSDVLARSAATYSIDRKSIRDVLATNPDVVIINGPTINAIQNLPEGSDNTVIDAEIANLNNIIGQLSTVPYVIIVGMYGFNNTAFTQSRNDMIRGMIVYSWGKLNELTSQHRNVEALVPSGITCDDSAAWLPGMCGDAGPSYVHLSPLGGMAMAGVLDMYIASRFVGNQNGEVLSDYQKDFANASSGVPANCSLATYGTGSTIISKTIVDGKLRVVFSSSGVNSGIILRANNIASVISSLSSGDKFSIGANVESSNNTQFAFSVGTYLYDTTNTFRRSSVYPEFRSLGNAEFLSRTMKLDRAGSAIGSSSWVQIIIFPYEAGTYTVDISPLMVYKN